MEVVAPLSQGRTAAAQCGLFTYKSVPVIFEPPCIYAYSFNVLAYDYEEWNTLYCPPIFLIRAIQYFQVSYLCFPYIEFFSVFFFNGSTMLRWFPSFQVATRCLSCSPPDLIFLATFFSYLCTCKITTAIG